MSGDPFNPVKDLIKNPSATSKDPLKDIKARIASNSASLTLLFGGNPVEGACLDPSSLWPGNVASCPVAATTLCALTQQPLGRAGEYSLDALCPPGSSNTDYLDHLVASSTLHVCRVYLSLDNKGKEEVVVLLLRAEFKEQTTIRHVRAALAAEFKNRPFPVLRTTANSPATSWRSEQLIFLSETGEKLGDDAKLPVASERTMRDFGRHSAVIAQLAVPTDLNNRMQDFAPEWDAAKKKNFADKVCLSLFGLTAAPWIFSFQS